MWIKLIFSRVLEFKMQVCELRYVLILFDGGKWEKKGDKADTFSLYAGAHRGQPRSAECIQKMWSVRRVERACRTACRPWRRACWRLCRQSEGERVERLTTLSVVVVVEVVVSLLRSSCSSRSSSCSIRRSSCCSCSCSSCCCSCCSLE